jgi:short-subunit dehydrogenase
LQEPLAAVKPENVRGVRPTVGTPTDPAAPTTGTTPPPTPTKTTRDHDEQDHADGHDDDPDHVDPDRVDPDRVDPDRVDPDRLDPDRLDHGAPMTPRRILLTGASSGIGAALAEELGRRGSHVWLAARRQDRLADVVAAITGAGGTAHAVGLDVGDAAACAAAVTRLDDEVGGFDVVVANAGVGGRTTDLWRTDVDDAAATVAINLTGALATVLPLLPRMRARGRGHVVGISSQAADIRQPQGAVYGATKAGLTYFLDSVAPELRAHGIACTIVHPGFVKSEMTARNKFPMPFLVETDAAARQIADAIDAQRAWLRFPWQISAAISLASLVPGSVRAAITRRSIPSPPPAEGAAGGAPR